MAIKFEWDRGRSQGILTGDHFEEIRERFSVANKAAKFARYRGRYIPRRLYTITPGGRFDPGLYKDIEQYIVDSEYSTDILMSDSFIEHVKPKFDAKRIKQLKLKLRDYQRDIVKECLDNGRGTVVLATAGGKTLTFATLLETLYNKNKKLKCALIVPDLGLVEQTYSDFIDYGTTFKTTKWTGKSELDLSGNVIVCNLGILQSNNSDTSWLNHVDVVIVDEVHKLRKGNKVNTLFKSMHTSHRFGFTGTMPEELIDQWNIIGKIGPVLYERNSSQLRKDSYVADVKVQILKLEHSTEPDYPKTLRTPAERYRAELDFIINSAFRNNLLRSLCNKFDKNGLILVDYIEHGNIIHKHLSSLDKKVYFIRGEVGIEDREKVKEIMEMDDNVIVVAISKIFSTGINIKNLHYIVFAGGGKAKIKTLQSIGRGLRLHKNKSCLIIFDIADDLRYGREHLQKRILHYQKENIEYGVKTIEEGS